MSTDQTPDTDSFTLVGCDTATLAHWNITNVYAWMRAGEIACQKGGINRKQIAKRRLIYTLIRLEVIK